MPRAHRLFLPGYVWHITHRCHRREFLLRFARDRRRWRHWLFEARKRYGLCVLNYIVTSNHIHLLVLDRGVGETAKSMQLIAGRTAQEYNQRKHRCGAYWEDRYHATAVDTDDYLARCMVYIDLNMVRAGAVTQPGQWPVSGYREIQYPPARYRIIDTAALMALLGIHDVDTLQRVHGQWVQQALRAAPAERNAHWSESLAVGSRAFVARFQADSGLNSHRRIVPNGGGYCLREASAPYSAHLGDENATLRAENRVFLDNPC
jgi:putative transposase